jgi:hypothetical protein
MVSITVGITIRIRATGMRIRISVGITIRIIIGFTITISVTIRIILKRTMTSGLAVGKRGRQTHNMFFAHTTA